MSDRDELGARFASFASAPTAPLPGAAAAQERGAQRTRRTRAALGGAVAAVLALSAGVALGGGGASGERDRVEPPVASAGPKEPEASGLTAGFLDAGEVALARSEPSEAWEVRRGKTLPFDPLPFGCRKDVLGDGTGTGTRFLVGPLGLELGLELQAYAAPAEAEAAFGRLVDDLECVQGLVGGLPGNGPDRLYGSYSEADHLVAYSVQRIGSMLSAVALRTERPHPESRDLMLEQLPPLADAAAVKVRALLGASDPVEPTPPVGLLTAEDAAAIEPGAWTVLPYTSEGQLLTPCGEPTAPAPLDLIGTDLRLERESGGSFVYQELFRYASEEVAAQALDARRRAVEQCPTEPITSEPDPDTGMRGTISYEVIESGQVPLVVRVNTQCETCPPSYRYAAVVQVGDRLTVVNVALAEDGDPGMGLTLEYAAVAAERLRRDS